RNSDCGTTRPANRKGIRFMKSNVTAALIAGSHSALMHFTPTNRKNKAIEEMGELIGILSKQLTDASVAPEKIIDEIADVFIMSHQLRLLFGDEAVDNRILFKL